MNFDIEGGFASYTDADMYDTDVYLRDYNNYYLGTSLEFLVNLPKGFNVGGGIKYEGFWNIENALLQEQTSLGTINSLGTFVSLEYKFYNYQYPFDEGVAVRLNAGYQHGLGDSPSYYSISGEVNSALILTSIQRIGGGLFWGYGDLPAQAEFRFSGSMGAFLLPETLIAADYYTALNLYYEIIFIDLAIKDKNAFGRLGFQIFYELGLYGSDIINTTYYHGPGIAALVYLNSISIPAIEIRFGWNIESMQTYLRFGLYRYL